MVKKGTLATLLVVAAAAVFAAAAFAVAPVTFTFGNGAWMPHTGHDSQFALVTQSEKVPVSDEYPYGVTYGGVSLKNFPSDPADVTALSFEFKADQTGGSGGSPRLHVAFSDGSADLRPLTLAADWTTVDGMTGTSWDNNGGTCGFRYAVDWTTVKDCHVGASITGMWVVNDSGWLYPTDGLTVWLDNITVNDLVSGGPGNSK